MALPSIIATQKAALQELAAQDIVADYKDYRSRVLTDGDPVDLRQLVDMQMRLIGAEADRKGNGFDQLPVFNFVFNNTGMSATPVLEESPAVPEKPDPWPFKDVAATTLPAPAQEGSTGPESAPLTSVEILMASVDEMLDEIDLP